MANNHTPLAKTRVKSNNFENKCPDKFRAANICKPGGNINKYTPSITEAENSSNRKGYLELKTETPNIQYKPRSDVVTPYLRRKASIFSVISNPASQLSNVQNVAPCTPQPPSDPTVVLKKKLKIKMEAQIKDKVALMPPSSPYSLMTDSSNNGTPIERFVKIEEKPSRSKAGTFVTETPFPLANKISDPEGTPVRNAGTNSISKKRKETEIATDGKSSPDSNSTTPKSTHSNAKRHKIEDSLKTIAKESLDKSQPNQLIQSHLITGMLGEITKACNIM